MTSPSQCRSYPPVQRDGEGGDPPLPSNGLQSWLNQHRLIDSPQHLRLSSDRLTIVSANSYGFVFFRFAAAVCLRLDSKVKEADSQDVLLRPD